MGQAIKFTKGDTLFSGKPKGRTGKDLYNNSATYSMSHDELRYHINKIDYEQTWIKEDIEQLSALESKLSKSEFKVAICGNHAFHCRYIKEALVDNGITNIVFYDNPQSCIDAVKTNKVNVVFTQYDFHDSLDGRDVFQALNHQENGVGELVHVCIVNGFTVTQYMNLKRSGIDVLNCFLGDEGVTIFKECIRTLSNAYYLFHLIELVFGQEESLSIRKNVKSCEYNIEDLESIANKSKFKSLLAITDKVSDFTDRLNMLGFTNITIASDVTSAIDYVGKDDYDLVLSKYKKLTKNMININSLKFIDSLDEVVFVAYVKFIRNRLKEI